MLVGGRQGLLERVRGLTAWKRGAVNFEFIANWMRPLSKFNRCVLTDCLLFRAKQTNKRTQRTLTRLIELPTRSRQRRYTADLPPLQLAQQLVPSTVTHIKNRTLDNDL